MGNVCEESVNGLYHTLCEVENYCLQFTIFANQIQDLHLKFKNSKFAMQSELLFIIFFSESSFFLQANPPQYDRADDIASLLHLNESGILHTLRQRYGASLIHTYAGRNLVIINPMHQLSVYSDKVRS